MIKVKVAMPVLYPLAGFLPTTWALLSGILLSKKVTVPPVAALLLVLTLAVSVTFSFTFAGLGLTESVMALVAASRGAQSRNRNSEENCGQLEPIEKYFELHLLPRNRM